MGEASEPIWVEVSLHYDNAVAECFTQAHNTFIQIVGQESDIARPYPTFFVAYFCTFLFFTMTKNQESQQLHHRRSFLQFPVSMHVINRQYFQLLAKDRANESS